MTLRRSARELIRFTPAPGAWIPALQAAIAVTAGPIAFTLAGDQRLGLLASFGALIVIYLPARSRRERAAKLPVVALGFLLGTVVGIATGASLPANLVGMALVAVVFSYLSLTFDVGPPGAIFPVLTAGSMGQLTAPVAAGGSGMDPVLVLGIVTLGLVAGYLVVTTPLLLPSVRRSDGELPHTYRWTYRFERDSVRILGRLTFAVIASIAVSAALGLHHIAWVLLAVIGILQKDSDVHLGALRLAQRLIGTALGVGIALVFRVWIPEGFALIAIVGVLVFGFVFLIRTNLMFALMLVTPMALLLVAGGSRPLLIASMSTRIIDTVVGAAVATVVLVAVGLVSRPWR